MDVVEQAEQQFRQAVLAVVDRPGPSPRARLFAVLHKALTYGRRFLSCRSSPRRVRFARAQDSGGKLQEHLLSDRDVRHRIDRSLPSAGHPHPGLPEQIDGLLHAIFFTSLHEDDFGPTGVDRQHRIVAGTDRRLLSGPNSGPSASWSTDWLSGQRKRVEPCTKRLKQAIWSNRYGRRSSPSTSSPCRWTKGRSMPSWA